MAYNKSNPPAVLVSRVGSGIAIWAYKSADPHTAVAVANYFTNGSDLGMRVGDVLHCVSSTAPVGATIHSVTAVAAGGAASLAPAILA